MTDRDFKIISAMRPYDYQLKKDWEEMRCLPSTIKVYERVTFGGKWAGTFCENVYSELLSEGIKPSLTIRNPEHEGSEIEAYYYYKLDD